MKLKLSYNYMHKKVQWHKNLDIVLAIDFINVLLS